MVRTKQLGSERRQTILKFVQDRGSASVAEISSLVGASPATVHRDLEQLAGKGHVTRVHGGAMALEGDDPHITTERVKSVDEKKAIAAAAVSLIGSDVTSVFLEASTTVGFMVPHLTDMTGKVFVTNSPEIGLDLVGGRSDVLLIGGDLRSQTLAAVGTMAIQALESVRLDLAFVGVSALDAKGLSSMNMNEAQTKSAILRNATHAWALGDGSKLGRRALVQVGGVGELTGLVTDAGADPAEVKQLRDLGLEVTIAK